MSSRLILNADDFGLTPGINQAVADLHAAGALTSASLMATAAHRDSAIAYALAHPSLGIGCHLTFVDGLPAAPPAEVPTLLAPNATTLRPSLADFCRSALTGAIRPEHIEREAIAQIRLLQSAGLHVTHVDTHKHVHILPPVLAPILRAMRACGIPALRNPYEPRWSQSLAAAPFSRRIYLLAAEALHPAFTRATRTLRVPAGTLGITATGTLDAPTLQRILAALPAHPGTYELCCHPAHLDPALLAENTRLTHSRPIELAALLTVIPKIPRTPNAPALIHYGDLS